MPWLPPWHGSLTQTVARLTSKALGCTLAFQCIGELTRAILERPIRKNDHRATGRRNEREEV